MKDLLFGASDMYTWEQLKPWVKSIRDSGFDGDVALVIYRGDAEDIASACMDYDVSVFTADSDMWGRPIQHNAGNRDTQCHQMRFWHLYQYLMSTEDPYQFVICTDSRDVIFQKNPSEFLEEWLDYKSGVQILAPSEGLLYENEPWGAANMRDGFGSYMGEQAKGYEIFNVGTIAGTSEAIRDLALTLYTMGEGRFIPNDQSGFNILVNGSLLDAMLLGHDMGWACQCGTTLDPQKIAGFRSHLLCPEPTTDDEGHVYTSTGELFAIVHQYDRVPAIADKIAKRYI